VRNPYLVQVYWHDPSDLTKTTISVGIRDFSHLKDSPPDESVKEVAAWLEKIVTDNLHTCPEGWAAVVFVGEKVIAR
jgi:hypothetical protein